MSAFDHITSVLHARQVGSTWKALCPAHEDKKASLAIAEGKDGRVLINCHAGCTFDQIIAAAGLRASDFAPAANGSGAGSTRSRQAPEWTDEQKTEWAKNYRAAKATDDSRKRKASGSALGTIVARYPYRDEHGTELYEVCRFDPKDFRPRKPDGAFGLNGCRRVVYRLNELAEETRVVIVEGEKDADRLWDAGLPATTAVSGANNWSPAGQVDGYGYGQQLQAAGCRLAIIIPDKDAAGASHALQVAASCRSAGIEATIVDLAGVPDKGDVSDFLDLYPASRLVTLIDTAAARRERAGFQTTRTERVKRTYIDWLWDGHLARGKATAIVGAGGIGKSTMCFDIAARISRGADWPTGGSAPLGRVYFVGAEDDIGDTVVARLDAAGADRSMIGYINSVRVNGSERPFSLKDDVDRLRQLITIDDVRLVVLDPITAYLGDETSANYDDEVRRILTPVVDMFQSTDCALLFLMHLNKSEGRSPIFRANGSTAFTNVARIVHFAAEIEAKSGNYVLAVEKLNVRSRPPALSYRIADVDGTARIDWTGETNVNMAQLLAAERPGYSGSSEETAMVADCKEMIIEALSHGDVKATDLKRAVCTGGGYSEATYRRARQVLQRLKEIKSWEQFDNEKRRGVWYVRRETVTS